MNDEFKVHKLSEAGIEKANSVAEIFNNALDQLKAVCPEGRHFSIVKTKLEEASFFAKKSVAAHNENQAQAGFVLFPVFVIVMMVAGAIVMTAPNSVKKDIFSCKSCSSWHVDKDNQENKPESDKSDD